MKAKEFVDSLFKGYEETAALADFKEELLGNLNAKIENFTKNGMDQEAAFTKACAELGDVSVLADELSLKKRKEVFEEVYMDIRSFMTSKRVAAYVLFGLLALFGIISALIVFFAPRNISGLSDISGVFAVILPFLTAAIAGFTFLGLTQETASMYPMNKKRAAWYVLGTGLISFGLLTMPIVLFGSQFKNIDSKVLGVIFDTGNLEWLSAIAVLIPFVLPGIGILVFLGLTEKSRLKPWAKDLYDNAVKREMEKWSDPAAAGRFGLFSGAVWIFTLGIFLLLGFLIGFKYSWLVFIFAIAIQLLIQGLMSKKTDKS
jgi:MFS family permease